MAGQVWSIGIKGCERGMWGGGTRSAVDPGAGAVAIAVGGWFCGGFVGPDDDDGLGPHFPRRCQKTTTYVEVG